MKNEKNKFEYRGVISGDTPVLLKIEHDKYNPELISTELKLLGIQREHEGSFRASLSGDEYGNLTINGENVTGHCVTLQNINGWSYQGNNANLNIESYEYGFSEAPIEGAESIYAIVELTPSGILRTYGSRALHYDGSISCEHGYPEEIEWDFQFGKGKAFSRYTYEKDTVYDNESTIQIERPSLLFEINTNTNASSLDLKNAIVDEAIDFSLILSLCYRKTVSWYEINLSISQKDIGGYVESPLIRRRVSSKRYSEHGHELINHRDLINGGLSYLVNNLRSSPIIESLRRSIAFLSSSQSNQSIEIRFFQTIISLESFCDGFIENDSENINIPSGKWKKIERVFHDSIKSLGDQTEMTVYVERIKKKLPELKGATTLDRILHCCKKLHVATDDLWKKDGLESGLGKALYMRNHLFHRAYCEDQYLLYANFVRIQILTERLILKHLEWPDEKIWRWYDQEMRRARIDV